MIGGRLWRRRQDSDQSALGGKFQNTNGGGENWSVSIVYQFVKVYAELINYLNYFYSALYV